MLLDKADRDRRLSSTNNLLNRLPTRDRTSHAPLHTQHRGAALPTSLKIMAGVLAKTEPIREVAQALDISESTVSRMSGRNSPVAAEVKATTEKIRDLALDKLMDSLGIIGEETLASCGAKDASIVARNLAGVVQQLTPRSEVNQSGVTLVIYAPRQKNESQFEAIDVRSVG